MLNKKQHHNHGRRMVSIFMIIIFIMSLVPTLNTTVLAGNYAVGQDGIAGGTATGGDGSSIPVGEFCVWKVYDTRTGKLLFEFTTITEDDWDGTDPDLYNGDSRHRPIRDMGFNLKNPVQVSEDLIIDYVEQAGSGQTTALFADKYKSDEFINYLGSLIKYPGNFSEGLAAATDNCWVIEVIPYTAFRFGSSYEAHSWESFQTVIANGRAKNLVDIRTNMKNSIYINESVSLPLNWQPGVMKYSAITYGMGIIYPEGNPYNPVNFICTDLEAEYLPETNEVRVRDGHGADGNRPYIGDGFATATLSPSNQFGNMADVQENPPNGMPTYLPGLTKTQISVSWGSGSADYSIRNNGVALYVENAHQFKNPTEKTDPPTEDFDIYRAHESMAVGEKVSTTVENMTNVLNCAPSDVMYDKDGWTHFKLPPIPPDETFIRVVASVNTYDYVYTPFKTSDPDSLHVRPQDQYPFKIRSNGELIAQEQTEGYYGDNVKTAEIPLPTLNLKAGGSSEDDPVKLNAAYDTTEGKMCINAFGIFDNYGLEDPKPIATSHTITIKFKSEGTTTFTNGETITHKAGDIVTLSSLGEQKFTRYFGGWVYESDGVKKWTSNVRMFGNDDYENISPVLGTEANILSQTKYYPLSDGATSLQPWCIVFPQPTRTTTFEICYEINPSLDVNDANSTTERIPDGESTYKDNKACITITLGPEVNFVARDVSGTKEALTYDSYGNPDYTKPYRLKVDARGFLDKLAGLGQITSIDTDTRIYVAPALPDGGNPFSIYAEGKDGLNYEVPINSAREIKLIESENDVLSAGANGAIAQSGYNQKTGVTLANKNFEDSYTFELSGDFCISDSEAYKYIYVAYYVNPSNTRPGVPPGMPRETTYGDNFVTNKVLLTKAAPPPPSVPNGNRNDPMLDCSIYRSTGSVSGGRYILANAANKIANSNTDSMDATDVAYMLKPGTEINPFLKQNPYGSSFTVNMPSDPKEVAWGYKDYSWEKDEGWSHRTYEYCCGALEEIDISDYPPDYWKVYIEEGHPENIKNQYVTKYMDVIDGKAVVHVQVRDVWRLEKHSESHCACTHDGGECGCEECTCTGVYWDFYRNPKYVPTTYSVMFDNIYTNGHDKTRVFSTQGRGTEYDYILAAGYGVGTVLRTRFLTDYQFGYAGFENGGLGASSNGKDFSMEGWMKFSMSSSTHNNNNNANPDLTNGGYPLEQTSGDNERAIKILNGSSPLTAADDVALTHMYDTNIVSNESLASGTQATTYGYPNPIPVAKGSNWIIETKGNIMSNDTYLRLCYFRLEPKEQPDSQGNMVRQAYTNKNYPDAVKINEFTGQPLGQGKLPPGYVASPVERVMGYVGLKVYDIAYINNRYPNVGPVTYKGETYQPMMGVCYLGNLVIAGSYENDAWVRPAD